MSTTTITTTFSPTKLPSTSPTSTPSWSPSRFPSISPSNFPTPRPTYGTILDYDLSTDQFGPWRIPIIVTCVALLHVGLISLLFFFRSGKPSLFPPKRQPISPKDKDRHMIAKYTLLGGSFLAWIISMLTISTCQLVRIGDEHSAKRERIAFGLFRAKNEDDECEALIVDDPARALVASRIFAVLTCILLGLDVFLFLLLVLLPIMKHQWESVQSRFPRQRVYRLWVGAISVLYASFWTTCYTFFLFGLEICAKGKSDDEEEQQDCERGVARLAICNAVLLIVLSLLGFWYIWDCLTPRPMTEEAIQNSVRVTRSPVKSNNNNNTHHHRQPPPEQMPTPFSSPRKNNKKKATNGSNSNNNRDVEEPTETESNEDDRVPASPKLPAHKNSVRAALLKKQMSSSPKPHSSTAKSPKVSTPRTTSRRVPMGSPSVTSSTPSSSSRPTSPRPGTKTTPKRSAMNGHSPSTRSQGVSPSPRRPVNNNNNNNNNTGRTTAGVSPSPRRPTPGVSPSPKRPATTTTNGSRNTPKGGVSPSSKRSSRTTTPNNSSSNGGGNRRPSRIPDIPDLDAPDGTESPTKSPNTNNSNNSARLPRRGSKRRNVL